ncbi:YveK family protein [Ligilactobacillus acidipiscis]|uniref:YveK family protein n=1 Tax=Ligilactobacillus acidipiscis TaxID=89059 RepID=UPI0023F7A0F0|nr:Wzz/FepE/Etk N-terminal domain-containing protein [Ligilactobacillus acidipiscis]WEV56546.1 Wzz/FepE/Etk N-terminal domain-containing protein [Ligilactobacillus acidipiscis]
METNNNLDNEFSLSKVLLKLRKGYKQIIVWTLIGAAVSLILSFFVFTPKYNSTLVLLVNQKNETSAQEYTNQQADLQMINTYQDVLKQPVILKDVLNQLEKKDNYKKSLKELENSISTQNQTNSQVIRITAKDKNAYVAADIANLVGEVFTKKIKHIMKINNVTVVSKATAEKTPYFPNKKLILVIGVVVGFFLGVAYVIFKSYFDMTVTDEKFITDDLSLVLLGDVNHIDYKRKNNVSLKESKFHSRHRV